MDIRNTRELKNFAAQRLENAPSAKRIALICAAFIVGTALLDTVIRYLLDLQIEQTGGLSNIGTRSILSTIQTVFPYARMILVSCIQLGYAAAMLRVARGQYTSPNTLRLGFDRFWLLLRTRILEYALYSLLMFVSLYISVQIFLLTPLSDEATAIMAPLITQGLDLSALSDAAYDQLMHSMYPAIFIALALYVLLILPIYYQYRMVGFVVIDRPGTRARAALRESKQMMKGNRFKLFRLDVSLWFFYLLKILSTVVCYGDILLPMIGVELPMSAEAGYFLFFGLYLVTEFAIFYFLQNRVSTTYALAYDSLRPKEKPNNGVVLGNIFNM